MKVTDPLHRRKGVTRYLSRWDAPWMTRYQYAAHHPGQLAGPDLRFTREFDVPFEPQSASLELVGGGQTECVVNGKQVDLAAANGKVATLPVVRGRNRIEISVRGNGYLLAQGEVRGVNDERLPIRTGSEWLVTAPGREPLPAFEFAYPPFAPPAIQPGRPR